MRSALAHDTDFLRAGEVPKLTLRKSDLWGLVLTVNDRVTHLKVRVVRVFPLSHPDADVAFLNAKGEELATIPNLGHLDPDGQGLAAADLAQRYVVSRITGLFSVRGEGETVYWDVQTNRGRREFVLRASRETLMWLGEGRYLLVDVDGNRFHLDQASLDTRSRAILDQVL